VKGSVGSVSSAESEMMSNAALDHALKIVLADQH
jgi:hypothetical protein